MLRYARNLHTLAASSQVVAGDTTVEGYDLASEPAPSGQEHRELSDILKPPEAPEQDTAWHLLVLLYFTELAGVH
jgi:hypothetical protein